MSAPQLENFNLLAESIGGVARLRELILSLAVRGRLVPQDPNDEPASELLKRIRAEKDRLIEEGKIKRDKPRPDRLSDEKLPCSLPAGWAWASFATLGAFSGGKTPNTSRSDYWDGDIPWITPKDMKSLVVSDAQDKVTRRAQEDGLTLIAENCVMLVVRSGILRRTVPVAINLVPCTVNQDLKVLSLAIPSMAAYVQLMIRGFEGFILRNLTKVGTTVESIRFDDFEKQAFPLPPLAEQSRIVAKVEELMALCDRLEAEQGHAARVQGHWVEVALDQLAESADADEFRRHWQHLAAHFDALFTTPESIDRLDATLLQLAVRGKLVPQDPNDEPASELLKQIRAEKDRLIKEGKIKQDKLLPPITDGEKAYELPRGWEWVRLDAIADIGTGTTPSRSTPEYWSPPEIPWVASGETGKPLISKTAESVSSLAVQRTSLRLYPVHTLVIALYGQGKTRGQISELLIEAATNQACAAIVPILSSADHKEYIKQYFRRIYDEIREEAAGGAQPNLSVGKIKSTLIPLPPLAEQSRIVAQVEKLQSLTASLRARLTAAQTKQAHLAEALIAELTTATPTEPNAEEHFAKRAQRGQAREPKGLSLLEKAAGQ